MKKILMILCLVVSTNLFAKTITDKTCDIYLIVDDHVYDWGANKQVLINKGYNPIEVYVEYLDDMKKIKNNSLVGDIYYSRRYGNISLGNGVDVDLEVLRMRDNLTGDMSTLYYKRGSAKFAEMAKNRAFRGFQIALLNK